MAKKTSPKKKEKEIAQPGKRKTVRLNRRKFRLTVSHLGSMKKRKHRDNKLLLLERRLRQKKRFSKTKLFRRHSYRTLIYSPCSPRLTYRFSAVLCCFVDENKLTEALYDVAVRFPSLRLDIRPGFFNFYLEENNIVPELHYDISEVCEPFLRENNYHLFRLLYYKRRISIEVNSWLCDLTLCKDFFACLIKRYFDDDPAIKYSYTVSRYDKPNINEIRSPFDNACPDSMTGRKAIIKHDAKHLILKGDEEPFVTNVTSLEINLAGFKNAADENGGEHLFLLNVLRQSLENHFLQYPLRKPRDIVIGLMENYRKYFPTESYHNFTLLDPVLCRRGEPVTESDLRSKESVVCHYISAARQKKYVPLLFKQKNKTAVTAYLVDGGSFRLSGEGAVVRAECVTGGDCKYSVSYIKTSGKIIISIASRFNDTLLEWEFYKVLRSFGLDCYLDTNRRNCLL